VTEKPRRIKVFYYCDEYAGIQNLRNDDITYGMNHLED
jgi:hypothetical protein